MYGAVAGRVLAWLAASAALIVWTLAFARPEFNPWRLEQLIASGACGCVSVGLADDPGVYFLAGPLAGVLGPVGAMKAATLGASVLALALVPVRLLPFGLVALALAAGVGDLYVFPAAAIVAGLPLLLERRRLPVVAAIALAAEFLRSGSGLPLVVGVALAAPWKLWLPTLAAFVAVHQLGGHVFWHTLYIGLGWQSNPYGIAYLDASAKALGDAAGVAYNSAEYEVVVRDAFLRLLASDPAFVIGTYVAKAMPFLDGRLLLVGLAAFTLGRSGFVLLAVTATALVPALMADARWTYQTGYAAAVLMGAGAGLWALGRRKPDLGGAVHGGEPLVQHPQDACLRLLEQEARLGVLVVPLCGGSRRKDGVA